MFRGANRRFPKGERKALWCARRRIPPPPVGSDAPTPARGQGLQPYGALTLFFRWRKKSVQKKASGTATPGKRLLLPILTAGLAMSRSSWLASSRLHSCALGARLFPPSKWAGLFPSAAYRRSAPPQLAVGILTPLRGFCFRHSGCGAVLPLAGEKVFCGLAALPLKRKKASAPVQLALGRLTPCRDSASIAEDGKWAYPLRVG